MKELTISKETVYQGKLFTVEKHQVKLESGDTSVRDLIKHPGAAAVLPIENENIYLIKQYRKALERVNLEIPAGVVEAGEDPKHCANRELAEELKMSSDNLQYLTTFDPSPGYLNEPVHLFLATKLYSNPAIQDEDEFLEIVKMPYKDLLNKIYTAEITDAKTIISTLFYNKYSNKE